MVMIGHYIIKYFQIFLMYMVELEILRKVICLVKKKLLR